MLSSGVLGFLAGRFGPLEIGIILVVLLLVFGNRIPDVMRSLGRGLTQFKKGLRETEDEIKKQLDTDPGHDEPEKKKE